MLVPACRATIFINRHNGSRNPKSYYTLTGYDDVGAFEADLIHCEIRLASRCNKRHNSDRFALGIDASIFVQARRRSGAISTAALALFIAMAAPALAADDDNYPDPVYMTGAEVRIDRAIEGDLIAAAGRIHVDQPVAGDAVLAAGCWTCRRPWRGFAGSGGHRDDRQSRQGRCDDRGRPDSAQPKRRTARTRLARGQQRDHRWTSMASMKVYGRDVTLSGELYGPVDVSAEHIEVRSSARIYGDIVYSSRQAINIDPQAQVMGKVTRAQDDLQSGQRSRASRQSNRCDPCFSAVSLLRASFRHVIPRLHAEFGPDARVCAG